MRQEALPERLFGLPPVITDGCTLLILGSFPSAASLAQQQYYAHPQNRFWPIVAACLGLDFTSVPYRARIAAVNAAGIGIWDVYGSCERAGSLDSAIRHPAFNDFARARRKAPGSSRRGASTPTPGTPSNPRGETNPLVLAAAAIAGVDTIYRIGGAQAIGALAYGTQTIAQVDKITGPGNAYVAAAKRRVFGTVGIDMIAGPSEILVISDGTADPDWVAMDLFSQAEHDEIAQAILLCPDAAYLDKVAASIDRQIAAMPRAAIITASMTGRGALIKTRDLAHACEIANRIAPEHLELSVADPDALLPLIRHAGAIFMGVYSSEALGDYCAGPNHVLPTARTARFSSPLGVYDFQKRSSIIKVSREGAHTLGKIASTLAQGEGLPAHAKSAEYRL